MREIKFRAWDELNGEMVYSDKIQSDYGFNLDSGVVRCYVEVATVDVYGDDYIDFEYLDNIMQYTGIKDVDGKEIYEGDIVQCNGNKNDLHEIKFGEFKVYGHDSEEAIDIAEGWYFKILDNDVFSNVEPFCYPTPLNKYWVDKIDVKVIGNIYENPELLA